MPMNTKGQNGGKNKSVFFQKMFEEMIDKDLVLCYLCHGQMILTATCGYAASVG